MSNELTVFLLSVAVLLIGILALGALSFVVRGGPIGRLCCRLDWHKPTVTGVTGINAHARCERCGYEGLLDSQGNLF